MDIHLCYMQYLTKLSGVMISCVIATIFFVMLSSVINILESLLIFKSVVSTVQARQYIKMV